MRLVRWSGRYGQSAPDDDGAADIQCGFDSVRDKHVSVTDKTSHNFCGRKRDVHYEPQQRDIRARLQILLRRVSLPWH